MKFLGTTIEATFTNIYRLITHSILVLFCSFFLTWTIRHYLLPTSVNLDIPLNFVFQTCPDGGVCSFPVANVSVQHPSGAPFFESGIPYQISLNLLFPDTPVNRNLGMFLSVLNFHHQQGGISGSIVRSAVLPYRSLLVRLVKNILSMPFLMFRFSEEKEPLTVELVNRHFDNPFQPTIALSVELQHKSIQVQSGSLHLSASFGLVRSFLYNWPIISSGFLFMMWGSLFAGTMTLYWTQKSVSSVWRIVGYLEAIGNENSPEKMEKKEEKPKKPKIKQDKALAKLVKPKRRKPAKELAEEIVKSEQDPSLFDERLPVFDVNENDESLHVFDINCNDESFQTPFWYSRQKSGSSPDIRKRNIVKSLS